MELHTPVEAEDDEGDVYAHTDTRIQTQLLVERIPMEYTVGWHLALFAWQIPHITKVEECRAVEHTPHGEAELEVSLQTHITHLHWVGGVLRWCVTRAECSWAPSSHTVATTDIEHSVEWQGGGVAVRNTHTRKDSARNGAALAESNLAAQAHITTHILRISHTQNLVVTLLALLAAEGPLCKVEQITCRLEVGTHKGGVAVDVLILVVVGVTCR